jgi:hypothetical protein
MENYTLEKWIWTEADFDNMGWHDASIYGMKLNSDLYFDIDYIFKWNQPEVAYFRFTFYVAPCTLIFKDIQEVSFELIQPLYGNRMEIEDIKLEVIHGKHYYTIITQLGHISFSASGYTQTVRMYPSFQLEQTIAFDERGGISFLTTTDNRLSPDVQERVNERRTKEYEHYTWAKERHILKGEIESLQNKQKTNEINLKDYLKEKNYLNDKLTYYNMILRGTNYQAD